MALQRFAGRIARFGGSFAGAAPVTRRRVQRAGSSTYVVPASIPLGLQAHGTAVPAGTVITTWPAFAQGHLPATSHLTVTAGGATVQVQQDGETYWPDGSVRAARVAFQLPAALSADTILAHQVTPAAGAPNRTALMTPAAAVAATDVVLRSYGGDAGSVVYETSLRDIVTNLPRDTWGTNPIGGWAVAASGPNEVVIRGWRLLHDRSQALTTGYHGWVRAWLYLHIRADGKRFAWGRVENGNWSGPVANAAVSLGGAACPSFGCAHELYQDGTLRRAWGGPSDTRLTTLAASSFSVSTNVATGLPAVATPLVFSGAGLPSGITVLPASATVGGLFRSLALVRRLWYGWRVIMVALSAFLVAWLWSGLAGHFGVVLMVGWLAGVFVTEVLTMAKFSIRCMRELAGKAAI